MLGIVSNQLLFITGLARTSAIHATLIIATIPVFTLAVGAVSGRERPGMRRILGVPIALSGIVFLLGVGRTHVGAGGLTGDLLIAANCLCYSVYLVGARGILSRRSAIRVTATLFQYGMLPILLFALPDLRVFQPSRLGLWLAPTRPRRRSSSTFSRSSRAFSPGSCSASGLDPGPPARPS
jgi:drug/metabolite transporter (DMT)-like permease